MARSGSAALTYRKTVMGWYQVSSVLDFDPSSSANDDNPFAGSKSQPTGKMLYRQ